MRNLFITTIFLFFSGISLLAQSVGINNASPDSNAILDITSTAKGVLIPRMTKAQRLAISYSGYPKPAGLLVYQTNDTTGFWYWDNTAWAYLANTSLPNNWSLAGNPGTVDTLHFIGTTDNQPLNFRVNSLKAGRIDATTGNVFFGTQSAADNVNGANNTALGNQAMQKNVSGSGGTALGAGAMRYANDYNGGFDNYNVAVGFEALRGSTLASANTGNYNTALGYQSMRSTSTGLLNTGTGYMSLYSNTSGSGNTAHGTQALQYNTAGDENTALGKGAMLDNILGSSNTAAGALALNNNTTGNNNTTMGFGAMSNNVMGDNNTAIGFEALYSNVGGSNATAVGTKAMFYNRNVAAPYTNYNSAFGFEALMGTNIPSLNIGNYNLALGYQPLHSNVEGEQNNSTGYRSMYLNTSGSYNNVSGYQALYNSISGNGNTVFGHEAQYGSITGSYNTTVGFRALYNDTASHNTAIGSWSLFTNTGGKYNTALGDSAGAQFVHGDGNTFLGCYTATNAVLYNNATAIGYNTVVDASNKVRLGNALVTVIEGQPSSYTGISDARFKNEIRNDVKGLDFIMKLNPVTYTFDRLKYSRFVGERQDSAYLQAIRALPSARLSGFIAQEVEAAAREAGYDFDAVHTPAGAKDTYGLGYATFVVPLVKAVQEQQQEIELLKEQNRLLEQRLNRLEKK